MHSVHPTPKFSVITVTYNAEKVLEDTIQSVIAQTYHHVEYIIVDGASKDGTLAVIDRYRERIHTVVSEPDKGLYDAMNKGIRLASGDLIGFLNSGDWYEPGALGKVLKTFQTKRCDLMFGNIRIYRKDGKSFIKKAVLRKFQTSRDWNHPTMFVRAGLYKKYPFADQGIHDDYGFYLKIRKMQFKIVTVDQVLANFQMGGASNQRGIRQMCRRIHDRYRYCYRANGYSRWYLIECMVTEAVKCLL